MTRFSNQISLNRMLVFQAFWAINVRFGAQIVLTRFYFKLNKYEVMGY